MKKEFRVYGIDIDKIFDRNEIVQIESSSLTDEQFIEISEEQGLIWTLDGFTRSYNKGDILRSIFLRIIKI